MRKGARFRSAARAQGIGYGERRADGIAGACGRGPLFGAGRARGPRRGSNKRGERGETVPSRGDARRQDRVRIDRAGVSRAGSGACGFSRPAQSASTCDGALQDCSRKVGRILGGQSCKLGKSSSEWQLTLVTAESASPAPGSLFRSTYDTMRTTPVHGAARQGRGHHLIWVAGK